VPVVKARRPVDILAELEKPKTLDKRGLDAVLGA